MIQILIGISLLMKWGFAWDDFWKRCAYFFLITSLYQKILRMFIPRLQQRCEKGGGMKLCVTDKRARTKDEIWRWTLRRRLVRVWLYCSLLTRGECDLEVLGLFFLRFQIKHKQCLPAVMCAALLCMVFAKKSVIMEVIPQERQTRALRFSPPATTPKHIFKMCNTLVLPDKVH